MYRSIVGDQLLGDTSMRTVDFVASSKSSTVKQGRVKIGNKKKSGKDNQSSCCRVSDQCRKTFAPRKPYQIIFCSLFMITCRIDKLLIQKLEFVLEFS